MRKIKKKIPLWVSVGVALVSFLFLNGLAGKMPATGSGPHILSAYFSPGFLHAFAFYGQFAVPVVVLLGFFLLDKLRIREAHLRAVKKISQEDFYKMSWKRIEVLVAEHFRQLQFVVEKARGLSEKGYLVANKGEEKYLIQTRQWESSVIEEHTVQECLRAVTVVGATGGIIVTSGNFTADARVAAKAGRIMLLGGEELHTRLMNSAETLGAGPGKGAGSKMKKVLWIGVILLLLGAGSTLLSTSKSSKTLSTIWTAVIKKIVPDQHEPAGTNNKRFTNEQIREASQNLLHEKEEKQYKEIEMGKTEKEEKAYYEIELVSGGHIFSDKVSISGDKIIYKNSRGLIVSLAKNEVKSMRKIEVEKQEKN